MSRTIAIREDLMILRTAERIHDCIERIEFCESVLSGKSPYPEHITLNIKQVKERLALEKRTLEDILDDIEGGLLSNEMTRIYKKYCAKGDS